MISRISKNILSRFSAQMKVVGLCWLLACIGFFSNISEVKAQFPVIESTATFQNNSRPDNHDVDLPNGIQNGDLLLMILRPQHSRSISIPSGWSQLSTRNSNGRSYVIYREANGSEGTIQNIRLDDDGRLAAITYRISNWEGTPEAVVEDENTTNPPSLTTSWSASPTLFLAAITNRVTENDVDGPPSGYGNLITVANSSNRRTSRVRVSSASRNSTNSNENPGPFNLSGDFDSPHAFTIAIKGKARVLTVTANPITKVYGQSDPTLTYSVSGFQGNDNASIITGSLSRANGQNVGTYSINQGNLAAPGYTITFTGANFSITPKILTITPDAGQFKLLGEADPSSFSYQASGFAYADNSSILLGNLSRDAGESAGFYEIRQGSLSSSSGNYTIDFVSGIFFEIQSKVLAVIANPITKVYGQSDPTLTYSVSGFQGNDNASIITGSLSRANGQDVGTYAINQGNLAAPGYTIAFTGANFSITPKNLTITPDAGQFKLLGEADPSSFSYQASGFAFADDPSILSGNLSRDAGESAGFYEIRQGSLSSSSGNYTIDFVSGIFFEIQSNPTQYLVTVSSQNPKKGTSITITAQLADVNGNSVSEAGRLVSWSELNGNSGTFSSSTSTTDGDGIATIEFTVANSVGVTTQITASGSGGLFGTSPEITTVDAIPTQLVFVQDPSGSTTEAGQPFAQQPIIEIQDADGNRVESASVLVSLSLESGSGELRGEIELQAVNGLATFSGLNIDLVGNDKVILAESEGLTSTSSGQFAISVGPAALFTRYAGIQQVAPTGLAVTTPPAVRVQDIFGNPISGVSVSFSVTSGGGNIEPTVAVSTNLAGIASLTSWILGETPGQNTLTASSSGFTSLTFTALGTEDAIQEFNTSTTWTVPPGVNSIMVEAWGGGGGGGGSGAFFGTGRGGGGGGGAYSSATISVSPGQTLSINVGVGGVGGANADGQNGGFSSIETGGTELMSANGGIGGQGATGVFGTFNANGGNGGSGAGSTPGGNGGNGNNNFGGNGGGDGGSGGSAQSSGNGNDGNSPGGGGGGSVSSGFGSNQGGNGGSGKIIITYPKPVNQFRAVSSGNWEDENTWEQQFSNGQFAKINSKPGTNSMVMISGENTKVNVSDNLSISGSVSINGKGELSLASGKSLSLNSGSTLTVGNEGILSLPAEGTVNGAGNVTINKGATLAIAHPDGISLSGNNGAIQNTGTRTFSNEANYMYNGSEAQSIGSGLPSVVNSLMIDNSSVVTLDRQLEVTLDLVINSGSFQLDESLLVDLGMTLNGSSELVVKNGVSFTADLLSNLNTNDASRIVLNPGAKYSNLGISAPTIEVQQLLTGVKGWRMLGSPVNGATYLNFLTGLESQGFTGSSNPSLQPNVLWWDETDGGTTLQGWRQPSNISEQVPNGRGHYVYVFDGGSKASSGNYTDNLPITLSALGSEVNLNNGGFDFGVTYTPRNEDFKGNVESGTYTQVESAVEGFNLLANPTASFIDFFKESGWTKSGIDETIYIWDQNFNNGQGDFREVTEDTPETGRLIAPYQAFWVRTNQENPSLTLSNEAKSFASSMFYGRVMSEVPGANTSKINLSIQGEGLKANASLRISDQGEDGLDPWDAFQLESLNSTWLNLYSLGSPDQLDPLVINHLSLPEQGEKSIPLYVAAAKNGQTFSGNYTLNWELPLDWPADIPVVLMDHISKTAIDMSEVQSYEFSFEAPTSTNMRIRTEDGEMKQPQAVVFSHEIKDGEGQNFRTKSGQITRPFTIIIGYTGDGANPEYRPEIPKLYSPYPNPFVDRTMIKFYLPVEDAAEVKIYDMQGREVGSFEKQLYPAGIHTLEWIPNAINLPKGVYLIHLQTSIQLIVQKAIKL